MTTAITEQILNEMNETTARIVARSKLVCAGAMATLASDRLTLDIETKNARRHTVRNLLCEAEAIALEWPQLRKEVSARVARIKRILHR